MRIEDIEIHVGKADFDFEPVRQLEAKCEATMAFSPAPTIDEMNGKLRSMAAKVGADAVVNVEYNSGVSLTSWKSMKGTGLAVRKLSDDRACPFCAEKIKRAAVKCRHCGEDVAPVDQMAKTANASESAIPVSAPVTSNYATKEPLKETNNPQMWLIVGTVFFVILMLIGMAG